MAREHETNCPKCFVLSWFRGLSDLMSRELRCRRAVLSAAPQASATRSPSACACRRPGLQDQPADRPSGHRLRARGGDRSGRDSRACDSSGRAITLAPRATLDARLPAALLTQLQIGHDSQMLVFSKTSVQAARISPEPPAGDLLRRRGGGGLRARRAEPRGGGRRPGARPVFYAMSLSAIGRADVHAAARRACTATTDRTPRACPASTWARSFPGRPARRCETTAPSSPTTAARSPIAGADGM